MRYIKTCCNDDGNTYILLGFWLIMIIDMLKEIGLSITEAKVYLALLELGSALAGEITKKSEVNRTNVYDALERLIEKGLVTYVISANRKVFEAVHPSRLREILKEKENNLKKEMGLLESLYSDNKEKEEAIIYKGKKGLKSVFEDILNESKTIYGYGAEGKFVQMFGPYAENWQKRRINKKIKMNIIWTEKVRSRKIQNVNKLELVNKRFIPNTYDFPSTIAIYGNKTVTIVWSEQPFAFMIKSQEVVKSNINFFKMLWKIAKD